jgi:hypothetical protein
VLLGPCIMPLVNDISPLAFCLWTFAYYVLQLGSCLWLVSSCLLPENSFLLPHTSYVWPLTTCLTCTLLEQPCVGCRHLSGVLNFARCIRIPGTQGIY